jgi:hypothetical protein
MRTVQDQAAPEWRHVADEAVRALQVALRLSAAARKRAAKPDEDDDISSDLPITEAVPASQFSYLTAGFSPALDWRGLARTFGKGEDDRLSPEKYIFFLLGVAAICRAKTLPGGAILSFPGMSFGSNRKIMRMVLHAMPVDADVAFWDEFSPAAKIRIVESAVFNKDTPAVIDIMSVDRDMVAWLRDRIAGLGDGDDLAAMIPDVDTMNLRNVDAVRRGSHNEDRSALLFLALQHPDITSALDLLKDIWKWKDAPKSAALSLDAVGGAGKAEAALRRLGEDLMSWKRGEVAWSDMTRSIILHGLPGTGKTFLVRAMAEGFGIHVESLSIETWSGKDGKTNSGSASEAIASALGRARRNKPAIVMIDELDNLHNRGAAAHNETWQRGMVNLFLNVIDPEKEEGIAFIGATNDLEAVDPAIKRPGRFDEIVETELPKGRDLGRVLAWHLDFLGMDRCMELAPRVEGFSPAEIGAASRVVKGRMRRERIAFSPALLIEALDARHRPGHRRKIGFLMSREVEDAGIDGMREAASLS